MRHTSAAKNKLKNNLANINQTSSTDRVLNLAAIHLEHRGTPEYTEAPLFLNTRLNKSVFLKHTLRMHEREYVLGNRMSVTKVVLPVDITDFSLGGFSCFLNDPELEKKIELVFGGDASSEAFRRDMQILRMMDALPTFDPFLLRERMKREGLIAARCYFDLSEADARRMREYVQGELQKIVRLALGNDSNLSNQVSTVTQKLMTDETAASLEPLRQVLQLSGEEWRDGVFAWKGFLYYSWNIEATSRVMPELKRHMLETQIKGACKAEIHEIQSMRRRLIACLTYLNGVATEGVDHYQTAYKDLIDGKPATFREFLKGAGTRFLGVGEAFGMIMHIKSFWSFRFGNNKGPMDVEEALEVFRDLDHHFSAVYQKIDGSDAS
jgi:hypothetical protein